jgi:hypothetical protein
MRSATDADALYDQHMREILDRREHIVFFWLPVGRDHGFVFGSDLCSYFGFHDILALQVENKKWSEQFKRM